MLLGSVKCGQMWSDVVRCSQMRFHFLRCCQMSCWGREPLVLFLQSWCNCCPGTWSLVNRLFMTMTQWLCQCHDLIYWFVHCHQLWSLLTLVDLYLENFPMREEAGRSGYLLLKRITKSKVHWLWWFEVFCSPELIACDLWCHRWQLATLNTPRFCSWAILLKLPSPRVWLKGPQQWW